MQYMIDFQQSFAILKILLESKEDYILADAGAMIYQTSNVLISSGLYGGIGKVFKRIVFAKEYAFLNKFSLESSSQGEVVFAPPYPGSIVDIFLDGTKIFAKPGSFLAMAGQDIGITGKIGGTGSFFGMQNISFLSVEGEGVLFLSGFGSIVELDVDSNYTIDTGHVLAYTQGLDLKIRPVGNFKSFMFSKEGLVVDFKGKGKVWVQTRNEKDYAYFNRECESLLRK